MAYEFDLSDVHYLRTAEGRRAVAGLDARPLTAASRMDDVAAARQLAGEHAGAALETAVLRRRAADKLDHPQRWLLTDAALQQATPSAVARHRARRLAGRDVHDVTCSVGADLVEVAAAARRCLGSDLDPVRLAMAAHNLAAHDPAGRGATAGLVRADALRPVSTGTTVLADPGRRDGAGRRTWDPAALQPPLDELLSACAGRDLVVKASPGMDFAAVPGTAEIEVVSWRGQAREATVWLGGAAETGVRRRASVLAPKTAAGTGADWEVTDAEDDDCPVREVGEWIVEPDPAVVRAGLVRQYAARAGMGQLDPRIAFLTGDAPARGTRAFRVLDHGPYREKSLRSALREHGVGSLEILVRGVDVDPDALRKRLKPRGDRPATVVLARIGDAATAYVCRAEWT
ncbi:THUMP-like domain-containing protein [Salinifilum ghardaiensis]